MPTSQNANIYIYIFRLNTMPNTAPCSPSVPQALILKIHQRKTEADRVEAGPTEFTEAADTPHDSLLFNNSGHEWINRDNKQAGRTRVPEPRHIYSSCGASRFRLIICQHCQKISCLISLRYTVFSMTDTMNHICIRLF